MKHYNIKIILKTNTFFIYLLKIRVRNNKIRKKRSLKLLKIKIITYQFQVARSKDKQLIEFFTIFLKDIKKALKMKKKIDPRQYLNKFYQNREYLDLFIKTESEGLLSFQKSGVDYGIDLKKINKKDIEVF